jgi:hypothetical protein
LQEQVEEKTVSLVVRGGKSAGRALHGAIRFLLRELEKSKQRRQAGKPPPESYQGKVTVKEINADGKGAKTINVADEGIATFERIARKKGVKYAIEKDTTQEFPQWRIYFKAPDEDAMIAAFNEYDKKIKAKGPKVKKPSLLAALRKNIKLVRERPDDKIRNKQREGPEL